MTTTTTQLPVPERVAQLDTITLTPGYHPTPAQGLNPCEAVAYAAGERHNERPACMSPVLRQVTYNLGEHLPVDLLQRLKPLLPGMVGTADDGRDRTREWLELNWRVRTTVPAWLDIAGLNETANVLRHLPAVINEVTAARAQKALRHVQKRALTVHMDEAFDRAIETPLSTEAYAAGRVHSADSFLSVIRPTERSYGLWEAVRRTQVSAIHLLSRMVNAEVVW